MILSQHCPAVLYAFTKRAQRASHRAWFKPCWLWHMALVLQDGTFTFKVPGMLHMRHGLKIGHIDWS